MYIKEYYLYQGKLTVEDYNYRTTLNVRDACKYYNTVHKGSKRIYIDGKLVHKVIRCSNGNIIAVG